MPGGDRTGPMGYGSMTGRGMGFGGRGYRNRFWAYGPRYCGGTPQQTANLSVQQELSGLKQQAEFLHGELDEINRRIEQIAKTIAE